MQNSCIVMVRGGEEANQVRWDQKTGYLMTYRRVEDMALNPPTGRVAMVILTGQDDPAGTQRALRWLRHRCPGCPITVVSRAGGVEHEMVARQGGAFYLTSGEAKQQLPDMISHALRPGRGDNAGLSVPIGLQSKCKLPDGCFSGPGRDRRSVRLSHVAMHLLSGELR